jgi:hypothetical protein
MIGKSVKRRDGVFNILKEDIMKRKYIAAFNKLQKMGVPVYEHSDDDGNFSISAEENTSDLWCDYYDGRSIPDWEFGVSPRITNLLRDKGLFAEWVNPGRISVYEI